MIVVTGKCGVGKTTILKKLNQSNVYHADEYVKNELYKPGNEVHQKMMKLHPECFQGKKLIKEKFAKKIFENDLELVKVNEFIAPYVRSWIKTLPIDSIIEMAPYIDNVNLYSDLFDVVIVINKDNPDISKFGKQTIKGEKIDGAIYIQNLDVDTAVKDLKAILP